MRVFTVGELIFTLPKKSGTRLFFSKTILIQTNIITQMFICHFDITFINCNKYFKGTEYTRFKNKEEEKAFIFCE